MDIVTKLQYVDLRSTSITGSTLLPTMAPLPTVKASSTNNSLRPSKPYVISNPAVKVAQISSKLSAVAVATSTAVTDTREGIELLFSDNSTFEFELKQTNAGASTISSVVRLVNICKIYNGATVLKDVNWEVAEGEKVGLVGVSGVGMTIQLRMIAGEEEPDSGSVIKAKDTMKIAFWSQEFEVSVSKTVKEEFMSVFIEEMDIAEKLEKVQKEKLGAFDDSEPTRRIIGEFDTLQRCDQVLDLSLLDAKINKLMAELGFVPEDSDRLVPSFGSGWQMRISLGKVLLQDPDLLLLDEPTNHLDPDTVSWLAGYLKKQDVSMVIVSREGAFLDQLCTKIVETDMGVSRTFQGNYSDYVIAKEIEQTRNMISRLVAGVNAGRACITDKPEFEASQASKTIIENEEAVIAVAAAEAVALAKAAVKFAKDAATMAQGIRVVKLESEPKSLHSGGSSVYYMDPELLDCEHSNSDTIINGASEGHLTQHPICDPVDLEPSNKELEVLQSELFESIAVRSKRQMERKAKRTKAAEKTNVSVEPIKLGPNSRKRRTSSKEADNSDPLRYLRGTTSSSKLLTAAEELEFSGGIQDLLRLEKLHDELQERCGGEPTFAQWAAAAGTDQKTLRTRLNYGIRCKDRMIKSNIRLVISIAKNYQGAGMNLQDLVQEGCRGLIRGAEKFDASKGFKFSTYAHWWIKQAVRKSLSDQSRTIRLPFHMVEATYRVKEAKKQLYSENGRHPDNEEVAEATGLSMKRLNTVLLTPKAPRSLDQKIGFDQNLKPSDVIADPEAESAEDLLMKQFMRQDLEKALDSLTVREKQVIRWRFGMEDGRMKTLQEIGEMMGVSRERIRQIESSAFRKLNKQKTKLLEQYMFP